MRISFSMDAELIDEIREAAITLGKKQSQIAREAIQNYLDVIEAEHEWRLIKSGKAKTISADEMERLIDAKP
ncbi:hypothetical protein FACS189487_03160 [Campylobacterota bacterium]|nr:hypothetical protein FACS189487_03160 [Campylobacterota bacterium]